MQNTAKEEDRQRRRASLKRLLACIQDNPISSEGYSNEILSLIRELNLDVPLTPTPPDIRDMAKHLDRTQERLKSQIILEIQNVSPESNNAETPLVARDLKDRFEGSKSGTTFDSALSHPSPKS